MPRTLRVPTRTVLRKGLPEAMHVRLEGVFPRLRRIHNLRIPASTQSGPERGINKHNRYKKGENNTITGIHEYHLCH